MKKTIFLTLIAFLCLTVSMVQAAKKKTFTGKITFKITIQADNIPEQAKAMLPTTMSLFIGKDKTKSELFTQMGMQSSIEDLTAKTKVALLDIMGQKFALYESAEDIRKERKESPETTMEITNETKEIAGYMCKKVIARKTSDGSVYSTAWFTDELAVPEGVNFSSAAFNKIEGCLLEYDLEAGGEMMMTFTAIEVLKKKIKDSTFEVPEGFKKTTREELQNSFGG